MKCLHGAVFVLAVSALTSVHCSLAQASGPQFQVLYNFAGGNDGQSPQAALVADSAGNLYGTTEGGGGSNFCFDGCGTVFELSPPTKRGGGWTETVLYRFTGRSDGSLPEGKLIRDAEGNLYGTAAKGGDLSVADCTDGTETTGCGVVFEFSPPSSPGGASIATPFCNVALAAAP
jgi:hypothetical protein